ncbi:ABCA3 [Symbiodinium microadriaticum]|nr:ABCA3 [Symbiodinium microadriaticum]
MDQIRLTMGVCPQHDVLFENLSVKEHILFFSQLKGSTRHQAEQEATELTSTFHLEERLDHTGSELSGGQRRKLSVAIAVCGGSKFVVLDEPTAGMDPLARRELWDLLANLRKGRTILLTTHYMDADVLGDRVGIMSLGELQCMGSTQFLKATYGAGYKLIPDKDLALLTDYVQEGVPCSTFNMDESSDVQAVYMLPFDSIGHFGSFFTRLGGDMKSLHVKKFGVMITSLEDVFLKVGEDHSVTPQGHDYLPKGIGAERAYDSNFM